MTLNKIITTAALVAASTALSSAAVVLSQTFTPSGGTATSLWNTLEGQTSKTSSITGLTCDRYSGDMKTITGASSNPSSISTSVSDLYGYSGSEISGKAFQINSFSLLGPGYYDSRSGGYGSTTQGTITISGTYNGASISYTSTALDDSANDTTSSSTTGTYQARVYSFENAFFDAGSTLTISGTGSFGYAVVKTTDSATISPETVSNASNNWNSVFSISAQTIPEPSAFGLLAGIGALAFAVSRRRRSR